MLAIVVACIIMLILGCIGYDDIDPGSIVIGVAIVGSIVAVMWNM